MIRNFWLNFVGCHAISKRKSGGVFEAKWLSVRSNYGGWWYVFQNLSLLKLWILTNIWKKKKTDETWKFKFSSFFIFSWFLRLNVFIFAFLKNLSKSKMFSFKLSENLHFVAFFVDFFSERLTEPQRQESPIHYEFSPAEFSVKAEPEYPTSPLNGTKRRSTDLDISCEFIKIGIFFW